MDAITCKKPFVTTRDGDHLIVSPVPPCGAGDDRRHASRKAHRDGFSWSFTGCSDSGATYQCTQIGCAGTVIGLMNGGTITCVGDSRKSECVVHTHVIDCGITRYPLKAGRLDLRNVNMSGECYLMVDGDVPLPTAGALQIACSGTSVINFSERKNAAEMLEFVRIDASGAAWVCASPLAAERAVVCASGFTRVFPPRTTSEVSVQRSGAAFMYGS